MRQGKRSLGAKATKKFLFAQEMRERIEFGCGDPVVGRSVTLGGHECRFGEDVQGMNDVRMDAEFFTGAVENTAQILSAQKLHETDASRLNEIVFMNLGVRMSELPSALVATNGLNAAAFSGKTGVAADLALKVVTRHFAEHASARKCDSESVLTRRCSEHDRDRASFDLDRVSGLSAFRIDALLSDERLFFGHFETPLKGTAAIFVSDYFLTVNEYSL